jgi:tetratricopeptide (TPR) repeat protein
MPANTAWPVVGALAVVLQSTAFGNAISAQQRLKSAFVASASNNDAAAYIAVLDTVNDPEFSSLESGTQHAALALAARLALATDKAGQAHEFAIRATQMPQQGIEDWHTRLSAAFLAGDYRDEAECVTAIARQWGRDPSALSSSSVTRAYRDTRPGEFSEARLAMLSALYDLRWKLADGENASDMWRTLSLLLLDKNDLARAAQVVVLVDEPFDIIAMRADLRYKPLLKSRYFDSDAHRVARAQIETLRKEMGLRPRSMGVVRRLADALLRSRFDSEVLEVTGKVDRRMAEVGSGAPPYDDAPYNYNWILNTRSRALGDLGRYDEAVAELRRAVDLPDRIDKVSQPINLAQLLCDLGRADEALQLLPAEDKVSKYGRMQLESVRVSAALDRESRADLDLALAYLREHQSDSASTLQYALLRAGQFDEAEQVLLARLADPSQQTEALVELQIYTPRLRPPRGQAWHTQFERLREQPAVRQAVGRIGVIERYSWAYN